MILSYLSLKSYYILFNNKYYLIMYLIFFYALPPEDQGKTAFFLTTFLAQIKH